SLEENLSETASGRTSIERVAPHNLKSTRDEVLERSREFVCCPGHIRVGLVSESDDGVICDVEARFHLDVSVDEDDAGRDELLGVRTRTCEPARVNRAVKPHQRGGLE